MPTNDQTVTMNSQGSLDAIRLDLAAIVVSPNVAAMLSRQHLDAVGEAAVTGYNIDKQSRSEWEQRNAKGMKLALQVQEVKNFPWDNCSNVKFPLLTIAALQFLARISLMTKGRNLVKVESLGIDSDGSKAAQAKRISRHMSLQMTDEDTNWIEKDEEAKFAASIVGSAFKKTYYDSIEGCNISSHVPASHLVMNYFTKDINKTPRLTELTSVSSNTVEERVRRGLWLEMDEGSQASPETNLLQQAADEAQGFHRPATSEYCEYEVIEQHCLLDLDGDGYAEPYIVYVRLDTKQTLRIVAKFFDSGDVHRKNDSQIREFDNELQMLELEDPDYIPKMKKLSAAIKQLEGAGNKIVRIDAMQYWTRYLFIPSPDGGVYGLGFGPLLGPMNEAVSSLMNQLVDSGTMANTAGGFLGRGVKVKGGRMSFDPFEWKPVDTTGDDLRKSIFPLPVREPSAVLFQLLGMLVSYSEKISGATDIMTGVSPGQNTPAETSRNTVEQGMMLFSGIYNRMYRSYREEIKKFYYLNQLYFKSSPKYIAHTRGANAILAADDYSSGAFRALPSASPEAVSVTQLRDKAKMVLELSMTAPGFDKYEATLRFLEANEVPDIDVIYPDPKGPRAIAPPQNPKVELEKAKLQQDAQEHKDEMQLAVQELQLEAGVAEAKIAELHAKSTKLLADAKGVDTGHQIALLNAQIGAAKHRQDGLLKAIDLMQREQQHAAELAASNKESSNGNSGNTNPS